MMPKNQITAIGTTLFYLENKGEVKPMSKTKATKAPPIKTNPHEAGAFTMRVANTNYRVGVYFSATSDETARDKILRLVRNEMLAEQAAINQ